MNKLKRLWRTHPHAFTDTAFIAVVLAVLASLPNHKLVSTQPITLMFCSQDEGNSDAVTTAQETCDRLGKHCSAVCINGHDLQIAVLP